MLVLVMAHGRQSFDDFREIAEEITRQAYDIFIHIVSPMDVAGVIPAAKWQLPTLTVSFGGLGKFVPPRGRVVACHQVKKLDQFARFRSLGIDTPRTERFKFNHHYDEKQWGEFCVLKPLPLSQTSKGTIQLIRTRRLQEISPTDYPEDHFMRRAPALVQQFIDTGANPAYTRVMTLFGVPLLWWRGFVPFERPELTADDARIEQAIIEPKYDAVRLNYHVSERRDWDSGQECFEFAARMHDAFPEIPLKGCDILKEEATGQLYAIEINGGGNVWHFSSKIMERSREQMGGREALIEHYKPWPKAAKVLIEKTRELAS